MYSLLEAKADNFPLKLHVRSKAVLSCLVLCTVGENQGVYKGFHYKYVGSQWDWLQWRPLLSKDK